MDKSSNSHKTSHYNPLVEELQKLTRSYFGSDAPQYFTRFIKTHLQKSPELVTRDDLISLIDWIELLASFFEADEAIVGKYMAEARSLLWPEKVNDSCEDV